MHLINDNAGKINIVYNNVTRQLTSYEIYCVSVPSTSSMVA